LLSKSIWRFSSSLSTQAGPLTLIFLYPHCSKQDKNHEKG
jgi:hypothetical protein